MNGISLSQFLKSFVVTKGFVRFLLVSLGSILVRDLGGQSQTNFIPFQITKAKVIFSV